MSFRLFLMFLFLVFSNSLFAAPPKIQHRQLGNGMDVYVARDPKIPAVMHMLWYRVGGIDDPEGYSGLAHYLEHLMFQGTKKFPDVPSFITKMGGVFNAMTSSHFTVYYELVQKNDLYAVMNLEADRMRNLLIKEKDAEKEKNVVLEERKMRVDNLPDSALDEAMRHAFFHGSYGQPVIGWERDINHFDDKIARKFYDRFYRPDNSFLFVVGDVNPDEVFTMAEKNYGKIKHGEVKIESREIPKTEQQRCDFSTKIILKNSQGKRQLVFWYRAPSMVTGEDYLPIGLASDILGGGLSSRMYNSLVLDKKLADDVMVSYNDLVYGDTYAEIRIFLNPDVQIEYVEDEVARILSNASISGVSEAELKRAKYRYKAHMVYNIDDLSSFAYFYGIYLALGIPLADIEGFYDKLNDVSVEQVNSSIEKVFACSNFRGYLTPYETVEGDDEKI